MFSDLWTSISNESMHIVHKDQMLVFVVFFSFHFLQVLLTLQLLLPLLAIIFGIRGKVTC